MILWIVCAVVSVVALLLVYLYFVQDRMIFYPTRDLDATPQDVGLTYRDVFISVSNAENIHGWLIQAPFSDNDTGTSKSVPTVLFCHGNGGNISHRLETAHLLTRLGANVLLIDYRGYGRSDGAPSEENIYEDATAAYHWLIENESVVPEDIVLFGRSLGGAVVIDLATRVSCRGLIIESSLTSAGAMGRIMFPFLPVQLVLRYRFDSIAKIASTDCPILVTHSPEDDIIPYRMGCELYQRAAIPKRFVKLSGSHNERLYFGGMEYRNSLAELLSGQASQWTGRSDADEID